MNILALIGRENNIFDNDIRALNSRLEKLVSESRFLVIGGAGSMARQLLKKYLSAIH